MNTEKNIGLIAGGGSFPLIVADSAKKKGLRVVAVAHRGETMQELDNNVDDITWIRLGQFGQLIKTFRKKGITRVLMAGGITKKRMFEDVRPDPKGLSVMGRLIFFHDDDILKAVAEELGKEGITVVSSTAFLPELLAPYGCLTRRKPNKEERTDIDCGWKIAKELGRLDIGHCVVVRNKTILAVEAIEGTDRTILRGGELARENAVVVKISKPDQDLRFDLPAVGVKTIETMLSVNASALAIESGKTLIFEKQEMVRLADSNGITVVAE